MEKNPNTLYKHIYSPLGYCYKCGLLKGYIKLFKIKLCSEAFTLFIKKELLEK